MKNIRLVVPSFLIHCTWWGGVYRKEGSLCHCSSIHQPYSHDHI